MKRLLLAFAFVAGLVFAAYVPAHGQSACGNGNCNSGSAGVPGPAGPTGPAGPPGSYSPASPLPATAGGLGPYQYVQSSSPATNDFWDGDSIVHGGVVTTCAGSTGPTGATPVTPTSAGQCFPDIVSLANGHGELNQAVFGTCLLYTTGTGSLCAASSTTNGSLIQRYQNDMNGVLTSGMNFYLMIGTNDIRSYNNGDTGITYAAFKSALITVTSYAQSITGAAKYITLIEPPSAGGFNTPQPPIHFAIDRAIADVATQYGYNLAVVSDSQEDCATIVTPTDPTHCFYTDNLHPDPAGHAVIATRVQQANYTNAIAESAAAHAYLGLNAQNYQPITSNIAFGSGSLYSLPTGAFNIGIGSGALNAATTAANNICIGYLPCNLLTTGNSNVAIGYAAQDMSTTGTQNVSVGYGGGRACTTCSEITAIGFSAGGAVTTGMKNTFVGSNAGLKVTTVNYDVGIGEDSLFSDTTGQDNVCVGSLCLNYIATTSNNVAVGHQAGEFYTGNNQNTGGSNSVFFGFQTEALTATDSNEAVIGYAAVGNGSNTVTLGNTSVNGVFSTGYMEPTRGIADSTTTCGGNTSCRVALAAGTYTWTFGHAWTNIPACVVNEESSTAAHTAYAVPTTSTVVVTSLTTTGNTDTVDIICAGRNS